MQHHDQLTVKLLLITTIHFLLPYGPFKTQCVADRKIKFLKLQVKAKVSKYACMDFKVENKITPSEFSYLLTF